jgi:hypothetical protein
MTDKQQDKAADPKAPAAQPQKQDKVVQVYAQVNLTVGRESYEPGAVLKLPAWQAKDLTEHGWVGPDKPAEDADGSDPNIQVEVHQRTQWTREPIVRGRRTPIPGEIETDLVGEGGENATSPWL